MGSWGRLGQPASDERHCFPVKKVTENHPSSVIFRMHELGSLAPAIILAVNCGRCVRTKQTGNEVQQTFADNMPGRRIVGATPPLAARKSVAPTTSLQPVVEAVPIVVGGGGRGNGVAHVLSQSLPPVHTLIFLHAGKGELRRT